MTSGLINIQKQLTKVLIKKSPEILTALGITSFVASVGLTIVATIRSTRTIDEYDIELTKTEVVKEVWKNYIPTATTLVIGAGCIIGAHKVHTRRQAVLMAAYSLSERALKDWKQATSEVVSEKQKDEIKSNVISNRMENTPDPTIYFMEKEGTWFYDTVFSRWFKSDIQQVRKRVNDANAKLLYENYISVNDFFYDLGLENMSVGDSLGWNIGEGIIEITFEPILYKGERPAIALDFHVEPRYDYAQLH